LWHCGHRLRAGASRVQALARRLRLLAFDVFFFGTAMEKQLSVSVVPVRVCRAVPLRGSKRR
jgi:hypothetical protein